MTLAARPFVGFTPDAIQLLTDLEQNNDRAWFQPPSFQDVVFGRRLSDAEVCSPGLPDLLAGGYATALPVFRFLSTLR